MFTGKETMRTVCFQSETLFCKTKLESMYENKVLVWVLIFRGFFLQKTSSDIKQKRLLGPLHPAAAAA
jgi:hypothetical protein